MLGAHPLADIGAAYGTNTIPALERAWVVAMDIDASHLDVLRERTPAKLRPHLETKTTFTRPSCLRSRNRPVLMSN